MSAPDPHPRSHETARSLWPREIEECECADTLKHWYLACRDFADHLISQIEADEVVRLRDEGWKSLVRNYLIGAKKNMRLIERVCAQQGFDLPRVRDDRLNKEIKALNDSLYRARSVERRAIIDWLFAVHGARGAEIAEELQAKEHHRWAKKVQSETEGN